MSLIVIYISCFALFHIYYSSVYLQLAFILYYQIIFILWHFNFKMIYILCLEQGIFYIKQNLNEYVKQGVQGLKCFFLQFINVFIYLSFETPCIHFRIFGDKIFWSVLCLSSKHNMSILFFFNFSEFFSLTLVISIYLIQI